MDKVIEKKTWSIKRIGLIAVIAALIIIPMILAFSSSGNTFKVDGQRITINEVMFDDFQDIISVQAQFEPKTTIQLDAAEGGVVEEIFAEDGANVEKGQPLIRLSNTALKLDFMNRETQIVEQINNLRSTRITLEQNKRQVQEQLLDVEYQLKESKRQFKIDSSLFDQKVIPENDFLATKANYEYLVGRIALLRERLATDEEYRRTQLHRIDQSVEMMERNLDAIRENLERLTIKAPMSGQLNSFDHEIGQTIARGENIGRIDQLDEFALSAFVDQYYLNRIQNGQTGRFTLSGQEYQVEVTRILPTVVNSQFEIKLSLVDSLPIQIRRGQSVQLRLELSAKEQSLILARGSFYQSGSGKYVYVLTDENKAEKRAVSFGAQNPNYIQVKSGLEVGDRVITSSYSGFGEAQYISIQ